MVPSRKTTEPKDSLIDHPELEFTRDHVVPLSMLLQVSLYATVLSLPPITTIWPFGSWTTPWVHLCEYPELVFCNVQVTPLLIDLHVSFDNDGYEPPDTYHSFVYCEGDAYTGLWSHWALDICVQVAPLSEEIHVSFTPEDPFQPPYITTELLYAAPRPALTLGDHPELAFF